METNEKKAYDLIAQRNGITDSQIVNDSLHESVKAMRGLVGQLPIDAKSALEDVTLLEVAVRERKQKGLAPVLFKAERARNIFALKAGDKKFSPLTYKRGYYIDKASPIKVAKSKDGTYVLTNQKGEVLAMANDAKTAQRQRVALSKASVIAPGKTIKSKHAVPVAKSVDTMIEKSQYETDIERLRKMGLGYDAEEMADNLSRWRGHEDPSKRIQVAEYGDDKDLDELVGDSDWGVREAVAKRGRDQDLDKLVSDEDLYVRAAVAKQGRDQDLDKLVHDKNPFLRADVARVGRDQDLDKLTQDPDEYVRKTAADKVHEKDLENLKKMQKEGKISKDLNISKLANKLPEWRESDQPEDKRKLARYGRDKDLDKLVKDKYPSVRAAVAKRGREQDLDKLARDKNWKVRNLVNTEKAAEKEDEGPEL